MSRRFLRRCDGVTLIELLVVVAIISVLAGLIVGMSSLARAKAYKSRAVASMETLRSSMENHRLERGSYPTFVNVGAAVSTNWRVLTNYSSDLKWPEGFQDPWGSSFQYSNAPSSFQYHLWSLGPNTSDAADDIDPSAGNQ